MLKTDENALYLDPILGMIGKVGGNNFIPEVLEEGIILIPHFGSSHYLSGYKDWVEDISIDTYGVCDHYTQILEQCPELKDPNREFLITVTPVKKENQDSSGGWRWCKWGDYIGTKDPQCEYLYDEPEIDEVFVYHIHEKDI